MFKHYLTYQIAQSFDRLCGAAEMPVPSKDRLLKSSRTMLAQFTRSLHVTDAAERSKALFVALICVRDCKETLDENRVEAFEIRGRWEVLHGRLEKLCEMAADAEKGQLRMFA